MKNYKFFFTEDFVEITMKPTKKAEKILTGIFWVVILVFIPAIVTFWGIVTIIQINNFSYAIIGILSFVFGVVGLVKSNKAERLSMETFHFSISEKGVTHIDVDATYCLSWNMINSFGIVNQVRTYYSGSAHQTCLYFSSNYYSDINCLKKMLQPKLKQEYGRSTADTIVFECLEDDIEQEIREKLYPYIHKYCDANKEFSFIETAPWV